jgi:GH24 family phage-related lysozyme (muramidase)
VLRLVNGSEIEKAAEALLCYCRGDGKLVEGLERRRGADAALLEASASHNESYS